MIYKLSDVAIWTNKVQVYFVKESNETENTAEIRKYIHSLQSFKIAKILLSQKKCPPPNELGQDCIPSYQNQPHEMIHGWSSR